MKQTVLDYMTILKSQDYSVPTVKTYRLHLIRFLKYYPKFEPKQIEMKQVREYLMHLVSDKKISASYQNNAINALKIYFREQIGQKIDEYYFPRPRKAKSLPKILNTNEVSRILQNIENIRDKCMIFLIYSAGLSPSEVKYIKISDIDSKKMEIFISSPKENSGRKVVLADKVLILLREYFREYNPKVWLFERAPMMQITQRDIQYAFKAAVLKSGIKKSATLTILKNSFATHLIEKGVDIRYVQKMLGHKSAKTTTKFLRVSKRDLHQIQSPLDSLDL